MSSEENLYVGKMAIVEVGSEAIVGEIVGFETASDGTRLMHVAEDSKTTHKVVFDANNINIITSGEHDFYNAVSNAIITSVKTVVELAKSSMLISTKAKEGIISRLLVFAVMSKFSRTLRREIVHVRREEARADAAGG